MRRFSLGFVCVLGLVAATAACGDTNLNGLLPVLAARDGQTVDTTNKAQFVVDLGEVPLGGTARKSFYLRNKGRAILTLAATTIAAPFSVDPATAIQIPLQEEKGLVFQFSPIEAGAAETVVTLASDGGDVTVRLLGNGIPGVPADCQFDLAPAALDFGSVTRAAPKQLSFRLVNKSAAACDVTRLSLGSGTDAAFTIDGGAVASHTVNGFDDFTVSVTFAPTRAGAVTGKVPFWVGPPARVAEVLLSGSSPETCPGALPDGSCPAATDPIYLNDAGALSTWNPTTNQLTKLGNFRAGGRAISGMTDIAIDQAGTMYAISDAKKLYVVNPTSGDSRELASFSKMANGLTFLPDGRLVASGAGVWAVDRATGAITETIVPEGRFQTSGDIIGLPDGNLYWAVVGLGHDELVRIDPATKTTTNLGDLGVDNVYGLAYANGELFGYLSSGKVVTIDETTAHVTATRNAAGVWWGATTNPVLWGAP
jgi:hypothetical protein